MNKEHWKKKMKFFSEINNRLLNLSTNKKKSSFGSLKNPSYEEIKKSRRDNEVFDTSAVIAWLRGDDRILKIAENKVIGI